MNHSVKDNDKPDSKLHPPLAPNELVSIVIPAYNAAFTISDTVKSALAQTHSKLEVVVVDDGSSDDTNNIVKDLQNTDSRLRLVTQENSGVALARNTGIDNSSGKYLAFLDADDLWHPEKISRQLQTLVQSNSEFVYSPFRVIDEDSNVTWTPRFYNFSGNARLAMLQVHLSGNGSSVLCTRELVRQVGGFDQRLHLSGTQGCEDFLFAAKAAAIGNVACAPWFLIGLRRLDGSMSSDSHRMVRSREKAIEIIVEESTYPISMKILRWSRAHTAVGTFAIAFRDKDYKRALGALKVGCGNSVSTFMVVLSKLWMQLALRENLSEQKQHYFNFDISSGPTLAPSGLIQKRLQYLKSIS